jgi:acyl-coenzyme A synthetase/AMP-(fatty) acid ligase
MTPYPLIRHDSFDAPIAYCAGRPIGAREFLCDVAALAELLPAHRHVINLCQDRYRFTVGLAAALSCEQVSLLPPSDLPAVLEQLAVDFADVYCLVDGARPAASIAAFAYPDRLAGSPPAAIPAFAGTQTAAVLFTSGSTGRSKPQQRSWGAMVRSALAAGERLGVAALAGAAITGTVPHQHSYGLESTVMLALQHGLMLRSERPFYPADVCAALAASPRPRILVTTPIHIRALLSERADLPAVDLIVSATAPLSAELAVEAETRLGAPLKEIYGCSEAGQLAVRRTSRGAEWHTMAGVVLRQDAQGTWAGGAPVEQEALLNDVIEMTGPGRFLLHGRTADLVNIAGKRTSLAYLNHHLASIAGVRDGAFVMPDEQSGGVTRLAAYVVAPGATAEAILAALRERVDAAFLPRPLILVDALPRNAVGKLTRDAVGQLAPRRGGS